MRFDCDIKRPTEHIEYEGTEACLREIHHTGRSDRFMSRKVLSQVCGKEGPLKFTVSRGHT